MAHKTGRVQGLTLSPEISAMLESKGLEVRELPEGHLAAAVENEQTSFPPDEADRPEYFHFRHANAGAFFLEAVLKSAYLENVALTQPGVRRVCLVSKAHILGMYARCGFVVKGLSQLVFGKDPWYEMSVDLDATEPRLRRFVQVAIEMNLSATCFLELKTDSLGKDSEGPMYALRWFTPGGEVNLCGHATLAASFALWEEGMVDPATAMRFSTLSGVLSCRRDGEGWVETDLPAAVVGDPLPSTDKSRRAIEEALRISGGPLILGRNRNDIMVEVTPQAFDDLDPDIKMLAAIDVQSFIVTCEAEGGDDGVDYRTRFFAPTMGIDEDPVTASAHCFLAPYWASKFGRDSLKGYHASARGATIRATVWKGEEGGRVLLKGKAVTVFRGLLRR